MTSGANRTTVIERRGIVSLLRDVRGHMLRAYPLAMTRGECPSCGAFSVGVAEPHFGNCDGRRLIHEIDEVIQALELASEIADQIASELPKHTAHISEELLDLVDWTDAEPVDWTEEDEAAYNAAMQDASRSGTSRCEAEDCGFCESERELERRSRVLADQRVWLKDQLKKKP